MTIEVAEKITDVLINAIREDELYTCTLYHKKTRQPALFLATPPDSEGIYNILAMILDPENSDIVDNYDNLEISLKRSLWDKVKGLVKW